jgi:Protein of unknown function (DUF3551)
MEASMRIVLIGLAALTLTVPATIDMASAQRAPRPWCLQAGRGGPGGGLLDCSYTSYQQCLGSVGGGGDHCLKNPAIGWDRLEGKRYAPPRTPGRGQGY